MAEQAFTLRTDQEAQALFGKHDQHLRKIEQTLGVTVVVRGDQVKISGEEGAVAKTARLFDDLMVIVRSGAPLRPWLLRIVANEALNRAQAQARRRQVDLSVAEGQAGDPEASPEAQALAHERRALLVRALNLLREDDRVVIAYRWFFDLSEAEMAEALSIARGTVKSRLSRAMARLREQLL